MLSPSLTSEAKAGNPFVETQQRLAQKTLQYQEPKKEQTNAYNSEKPVEKTLINIVNTNTNSPTSTNHTNLERKAETIPTPMPEQLISQPQYAQQYPSQQPPVCKQVTPMLIKGAPEVRTIPQTNYSSQLIIQQPLAAQPVVPAVPTTFVQYRTLPFGGLFRWLFAPRHYDVVVPYGAQGVIHTSRVPPTMGMGMGMGFNSGFMQGLGFGMPMGPGSFGPHFMNGMGGTPGRPGQYRLGW